MRHRLILDVSYNVSSCVNTCHRSLKPKNLLPLSNLYSKQFWKTDLGSKTGVFLMILTILCGLFCFILCLISEASRSEVRWLSNGDKGKEEKYECVYSGSGKTPLLCAAIAFVGLAVAMFVQHLFVLIAVSQSPPPALIDWDWNPISAPPKALAWQAAFFFITTWICFVVGEILLLTGLSVESGHLKNWNRPKQSCLVIKEGLFSAAGVFALATVFLAAGLYVTALRAQTLFQEQEIVRREVLETSALHASPPASPHHPFTAIARENPIIFRENYTVQPLFPMPTFSIGKV